MTDFAASNVCYLPRYNQQYLVGDLELTSQPDERETSFDGPITDIAMGGAVSHTIVVGPYAPASSNNAKHSQKAVFEAANTVLSVEPGEKKNGPLPTLDATFVHMHSLVYEKQPDPQITIVVGQVQTLLRASILESDKKWRQYGVFLVISNMAACFSYGAFESPLRRPMQQKNYTSAKSSPKSDLWLKFSIDILSSTTEIIFSAKDEKTILPLLHVLLVFLDSLCNVLRTCDEALALLVAMPWTSIISYLNDLFKCKDNLTEQVKNAKPGQKVIPPPKNDPRPLTEDCALRTL
ncbi:Hypothetical protein D9617_89g071730 [Elsinoe fawcettii]|nr:Hypothetical protein D9617_89g071730 [Elsinoe fawcettii]